MSILHVVVPVFNEGETLEPCLERVVAVDLPDGWSMALHVVDDHSEAPLFEHAKAVVESLQEKGHRLALHRHERNRGKGAAVRTAFDAILEDDPDDTDLVIIQDADLEYDPDDFPALMAPILDGDARAVVGNRWGDHAELRGITRHVHAFGNRVLTWLSNLMTGLGVEDMECCYKVLTVDVLRRVRPMLSEDRFGVEPQLMAGLARLGEHVAEVPVHYDPRGPSAGKKIGWRDGVRACWVIVRERGRAGGSRQ